MKKTFMDSSNVKVHYMIIYKLDASRLVHDKLSSLQWFMNI